MRSAEVVPASKEKEMLKQYQLVEEDSNSVLLVWLEYDNRVKEGSLISLKEVPERKWRVVNIYDTRLERNDIKRGWNNNI